MTNARRSGPPRRPEPPAIPAPPDPEGRHGRTPHRGAAAATPVRPLRDAPGFERGGIEEWEAHFNIRRRPTRRDWQPFAEARAFVQTLGLPGEPEWRVWAKSAAGQRTSLPTHTAPTGMAEWNDARAASSRDTGS